MTRRFAEAERMSDAIVHLIGLAMAIGAVPVLILLGVQRRGEPEIVAAVTVYGVCLIAMIFFSLIYNFFGHGPGKVLKRLDHSAIYLKIAGTYTPLALLSGGAGALFLVPLWGAALGGTSLKLAAPDRLKWLSLGLYLALGWAGVVIGRDMFAALTPGAWWLVVSGGLLYTVGVAFFLWERLPFHKPIWHAFVLVASGLLYAAVLIEVLRVV